MTIFEFNDYRDFLRKYIKKLPKQGHGEIHRMAGFMGIHPSLLSQVLSDSKNLTLEQAQLLAKYLGLSSNEREYLFCSVQVERAGTADLKIYFKEKLIELKQGSLDLGKTLQHDRKLSSEETAIYYSHWHYGAIWLSTTLKNGKNLDEVAELFEISRDRAFEVLHFLVETRLCIVENGRYLMGPQSIHLSRGSPHMSRHHTNWRLRAIENSDKIAADEIMYSGQMSISENDFKKLRMRLSEVIKEVIDVAIPSDPESLISFNLDFFRFKK